MSGKRQQARKRRHRRVRKRVVGTPERPRLNIFRSHKHIYAQVIDDSVGHTLASASTIDPELRQKVAGKEKTAQAAIVGQAIAERAKGTGVTKVVFDRGGYDYHGRVKAVAEAAREGGLDF